MSTEKEAYQYANHMASWSGARLKVIPQVPYALAQARGQYRSSHKIGLHQGKYEALRQQKPVKVYRDNNLDGKYDLNENTVQEGIFGINIHRATGIEGKTSTQIDKWSAGCQVIAANADFKLFMEIANKAKDVWGNSFTYTLIESKDIVV
jgi:hypothetical protein